MSQRWIEGNLYAPKVQRNLRNAAKYRWIGLLMIDPPLIILIIFLLKIFKSLQADIIPLCTIAILSCVILLLLSNFQYWTNRRLIIKQVDARYFCGEFSAYLQYENVRHDVEWANGVKISTIMVFDEYQRYAKLVPYIALWKIGENPPQEERFILSVVRAFHGVLLPDTPEVRQYLQERLGLKEIPEYPRTAIYSPSQQDPRWVEE